MRMFYFRLCLLCLPAARPLEPASLVIWSRRFKSKSISESLARTK